MADCKFCGKPAGWFKSAHAECQAANDAEVARKIQEAAEKEAVVRRIGQEVDAELRGTGDLADLDRKLTDHVAKGEIDFAQRNELLVSAWERAADAFLEDGVLSEDEDTRLMGAMERFMLKPTDLNRNGALMRVGKVSVLRLVLSGEPPTRDLPDGAMVNLKKGERLVWTFEDVKYLEDRAKREFVGRSQGVSLRVMSGVYYRVGAFKGHPVVTTERTHVATGTLFATTGGLYFVSPSKSLRIPYEKIVSFEPFSDGIGLMRDLATAKPQIFVTDDGWFAFNLITNLAKL